MSDSPGLVDFAIGLVNSVRNLPDGQVEYFEEFNLQKNCEILLIKKFWGLVEITFGQVNASFSLPEWQAVKMTFFAPCFSMPGSVIRCGPKQPGSSFGLNLVLIPMKIEP